MSGRHLYKSLSPRASKLMVEIVIGVIGILGIMLAHAVEPEAKETLYQIQQQGKVISSDLTNAPAQVDWFDVLF